MQHDKINDQESIIPVCLVMASYEQLVQPQLMQSGYLHSAAALCNNKYNMKPIITCNMFAMTCSDTTHMLHNINNQHVLQWTIQKCKPLSIMMTICVRNLCTSDKKFLHFLSVYNMLRFVDFYCICFTRHIQCMKRMNLRDLTSKATIPWEAFICYLMFYGIYYDNAISESTSLQKFQSWKFILYDFIS